MKRNTTIKSMNLSGQKADILINFKASKEFKVSMRDLAKKYNMTLSSFIRVAIEDKMKILKK